MSAYATTGGQNHLLITGDQTPIWRWSYSASYYLYDIEKKAQIFSSFVAHLFYFLLMLILTHSRCF